MTTPIKILTILFLVTLEACNNSAADKHEQEPKQPSSVSFVDGHYIIDTSIILTNKNLLHLINELNEGDIVQKKTYQEIPICIKSFLDSLSGNFSIANPGETWRAGCTPPFEIDSLTQREIIDPETKESLITVSIKTKDVPARQLAYLGLGNEIALMKYNIGGIGTFGQILVFKFSQNRVIDFWVGETGYSETETKSHLINTLTECYKNKGEELRSNMIYL
jgi:hypothetical protein